VVGSSGDEHQRAAADAQRTKADVRLGYAELQEAPVGDFSFLDRPR
jgi:hypothetical protein